VARVVTGLAVLAVEVTRLVVLHQQMVEVAAAVGAHLVVQGVQVAVHLVVKQLTLTATQSLGQVATQQEFTGAYRDIFSYTTYYGATI
jgi:hypothetical protein